MRSPMLRLPRCSEISERLSEFLDDELDDETRHEIALHLAMCEGCAQLATELAATVHALHTLRARRADGVDVGLT